ncbi:MAG: homoserine dehydrogenase [Selenomonadaceae bacterium]|nr:homoserine dehydrogenase [Selenomonadaceae bacterium]
MDNKPVIKIALLGAGTIGGSVIKVLTDNKDIIAQRAETEIQIKNILVLPHEIPALQEKGFNATSNFDEILNDPEISIVVELIGGTKIAKTFMLQAMEHGKSVVTANKDAVAQFGSELFDAAEKNHVDFLFEASVGGAIPIIMPLKRSLTGNKISEILGIVNGTTNYMLTKMTEDGADYDTVLKEAQAKGYAEANPAADVEGKDAARKIAILASIAFNSRVQFDDVSIEGITKITPKDIQHAANLGYVVKLLAIGKESEAGVDVRVHPVLLPKTHPLASVNGVFNAIFVKGYPINEAMFFGPGAGFPTASAVIADIIEIAKGIQTNSVGRFGCTCYNKKPICPIEETVSSYYIRLLVDDKPGVLGAVATTFGNAGVSLNSVAQTNSSVEDHAELVVVTHKVKHKNILIAQDELKKLSVVDEISSVMRVES